MRPPGHHAGHRGLLDGAKSCGFCIFNNVAAGALHALEGQFCERVAIIDIDVHHGKEIYLYNDDFDCINMILCCRQWNRGYRSTLQSPGQAVLF